MAAASALRRWMSELKVRRVVFLVTDEVYQLDRHAATILSARMVASRRTVDGYHLAMRPLSEIRRSRLSELSAEYGGQSKLAAHIDKDRRQISAWLADPGKPGAKSMSNTTAREIERLCVKPSGWLDHEQGEAPVNIQDNLIPSSRRVRMDRARIHDAIALLTELAELQGVPALSSDPEAIAIAYDFLAEFDSPVESSNILDMTKRLAAKLRGEDRNGNGDAKAG